MDRRGAARARRDHADELLPVVHLQLIIARLGIMASVCALLPAVARIPRSRWHVSMVIVAAVVGVMLLVMLFLSLVRQPRDLYPDGRILAVRRRRWSRDHLFDSRHHAGRLAMLLLLLVMVVVMMPLRVLGSRRRAIATFRWWRRRLTSQPC